MTLKEINEELKKTLQIKIEKEIKELIEPTVKQIAKELASNVQTMIIYENHFMEDRLKIDISESMQIDELKEQVKYLERKLAQNGIN